MRTLLFAHPFGLSFNESLESREYLPIYIILQSHIYIYTAGVAKMKMFASHTDETAIVSRAGIK